MNYLISTVSIGLFLTIIALTSSFRGFKSIFWAAVGIMSLGILGFDLPELPWNLFSLLLGIAMVNTAMIQTKGADYLAFLAVKCLRKSPKLLEIVAPVLAYCLGMIFGSGSVSLLLIPAAVKLAKEQNIPPVRLVTSCVVAAQQAIVASPFSALNLYFFDQFKTHAQLNYGAFALLFPTGLLAVILANAFIQWMRGSDAQKEPPVVHSLSGQESTDDLKRHFFSTEKEFLDGRRSCQIFVVTMLMSLFLLNAPFALARFSFTSALFQWPSLDRTFFLFCVSAGIMLTCAQACWDHFVAHAAFRSGVVGSLQVLTLGTFGKIFIDAWWPVCSPYVARLLEHFPIFLIVLFFFTSAILYSQSLAAQIFLPAIASLGLKWSKIIGAFPALAALYLFPNHATVSASTALDDTGSSDLGSGKWLYHPFLMPNIVLIGSHLALLNASLWLKMFWQS